MILVDEGLGWTLHAGSRKTLWWQLLRQKLPVSSSAVRSWSGGLAGAQHDRTLDTGTRARVALSPFFKAWPVVKFSQRAKRAHPGASERKKTLRSSVQGPVRPQIPVVASVDARTRRGFSPGLDALGWIFGLRMKPLGVSVVLKAATLPSSVSLPLLPSVHPPFLLIWMTCQTKALDANTL